MKHEIKVLQQFAMPILSGEKTFEVRKDDRMYQKGDKVSFKVVNERGDRVYDYPLLEVTTYEITYVVHGYGLEFGCCAFGIRKLPLECDFLLTEKGKAAARKAETQRENEIDSFNMLDLVENACEKIISERPPKVEIGQPIWQIWYNDDKGSWNVDKLKVTGVGYDGLRVSDLKEDPLNSNLLINWSEIGDEFFLSMEEAEKEAEKRNRIEQEAADAGESKEV